MKTSLEVSNDLLDKIRSGRAGRDQVIVSLFEDKKLRNSFRKMILNQGWPKSAFDSIFTDSIVSFTSSVIRRKDFRLNSDLHNYILVIGKRLYMKDFVSDQKINELSEASKAEVEGAFPLDLVIEKERNILVGSLLSKLGRNCREVLTYWASNYSMNEIAELMNYKSDMMARKKKYKCFKELTELVIANPHLKNILK